jgi:hypothetical protein
MRPRTEDLLKLRDDEPIDAALKQRLLADSGTCDELRRLARLKDRLGELPELRPSAHADARVLTAMRTAVKHRSTRRIVPALGMAAAAVLAITVVLVSVLRSPPAPNADGAAAPSGPRAREDVQPAGVADYLALIEESASLEQVLFRLPAQRSVMTIGTASTIAGLESQIALIDEELTLAAADLEPQYRTALWRERVGVMNALVQVRYAQSQLFLF